jgi:thioredoxin 1
MTATLDPENLRAADGAACRASIARGDFVLLDFWAEWCGPCRSLKPVLADLAGRRPALTILKVDIEKNDDLAEDYDVRSVPSLLLFKEGACVDRRIGKASFGGAAHCGSCKCNGAALCSAPLLARSSIPGPTVKPASAGRPAQPTAFSEVRTSRTSAIWERQRAR